MEPSHSLKDMLTSLIKPTDSWTVEDIVYAIENANTPLLHDMADAFQSYSEELDTSSANPEILRNRDIAQLIRDNTK
jgi:hypothetical protein